MSDEHAAAPGGPPPRPGKKRRVPRLCRHKGSGRGYVTDPALGREVYLGGHGTEACARAYQAWLAGYLARPDPAAARPCDAGGLSVEALIAAYLRHADARYRKGGRPTSEVSLIEGALRRLRDAHADAPAAALSRRELRALRDRWASEGALCRDTVNRYVARVVRMYAWAVDEELVPEEALARLRTLGPLERGRSPARETGGVPPAPLGDVLAVLPRLAQPWRDAAGLQLAAACRPAEALSVRPRDLDRSREPWLYRVPDEVNKTAHKGIARVVPLGPKARGLLLPRLAACASPESWCFPSPQGRGRRASGRRYRDVVAAACAAAGVPPFAPNQLRHTQATAIRAAHGIEAARVVLGHSDARTTEIYAERDMNLAARVAEEMG